MKIIKTSIIPSRQQFVKVHEPHELDKKAICVFVATGFFLGTDTYWKDLKVLAPGTINTVDDKGFLIDSKPWFKWHYTPREISFENALKEFTELFEGICVEQVKDKRVLLPLSGGLDSRTQAVAYSKLHNPVTAYSYSFKGGFPESEIARKMAQVSNFDFKEFTIEPGYLWSRIEDLAQLNGCYSEFTHSRQMAVLDEFKKMKGVFSLGHGGDLFFDRGAPKGTTKEQELPLLFKQILKKGGLELAESLWNSLGLEGGFKDYLHSRIEEVYHSIKIDNSSAKLRAFKSMTYVPRWTSTNLSVFEAANPIELPYFDDRMCEFICTIPEEILADRKIQIEYIKQQSPDMANITWEAQRPYNLYTYHNNKVPNNLPYRIINKLKRVFNERQGKLYIQRNWELQFLGMENDERLQSYLFEENLHPLLSKELITRFYNKFKTDDRVKYSHPVSMLLTLAVWYRTKDKSFNEDKKA